MDPRREALLIEGLQALAQGESLEAVLARHPDDAAALRPLLALAVALPEQVAGPRPEAQAAARRAFLSAAAAAGQPRQAWWRRQHGAALCLGAGAMAVLLLAIGSRPALPGDLLYPAKQVGERVWLTTTPAGPGRDTVIATLRARRQAETRTLLAQGRAAAVTLEGPIEAVRDRAWVVAGIPAEFMASTSILGTPEIGEEARIWGHTAAGRLWVDTIVCDPPAGGAWDPPPTAAPPAP